MDLVASSVGRATLKEEGPVLTIDIPPARPLGTVLFLSFWLIAWAVGEFFAGKIVLGALFSWLLGGSSFFSFTNLFMLTWLCGWSFGGFFAMHAWLKLVFGTETLVVQPDQLDITQRITQSGKAQHYAGAEIRNLRVVQGKGAAGVAAGDRLAFDYGDATVTFGNTLSKSEARLLVQRIREKLDQPRVALEEPAPVSSAELFRQRQRS